MSGPGVPEDRSRAVARVWFRSLTREDFAILGRWLSEPHVRHWWQHDPSPSAVEADFGPAVDGTEPTRYYLVHEESRPVGLIQSYRIGDHPGWSASLRMVNVSDDAIGIDYLIGDRADTGRGLGTEMISSFVDRIWREHPGADGVVAAVQQGNIASWRALEKAGFTRIWSGILESDDPSDSGPSHVYCRERPTDAES